MRNAIELTNEIVSIPATDLKRGQCAAYTHSLNKGEVGRAFVVVEGDANDVFAAFLDTGETTNLCEDEFVVVITDPFTVRPQAGK